MENQQQATTLCRSGCGFYGSPANEGLCSKCYKDQIKRKQDTARLSPTSVSTSVCSDASTSHSSVVESLMEVVACAQSAKASSEVVAQLESAEALAAAGDGSSSKTLLSALPEAETPTAPSTAAGPAPPASKKANRCHTCNKRVGLTGFACRCGGMYCGEHRYDKAHDCSFDYKTMEREEIRKNNPMIVSEKIQRI